ncbi:MAG: hypothetical protein ABIJ03_04515 [Patescibacteria group bacterium]|nr:hypothetical protein [Patescibacteria group bacterium]
MSRIRKTNQQKILLEQDVRIFRTSDLAVLWETENKNTLWTTIRRYIQRRILYKIHKGLYSTMPLEKLNKFELGCAISGQLSYVSAETVLQNSGIIMQNLTQITIFGKKKKQFEINGISYLCRHLNNKYLLNREGIEDGQQFSMAIPERAMADMLYINSQYFFDNELSINKNKLTSITKEVGYQC